MPTLIPYTQLLLTFLLIVIYVLIYKYQANKLKSIEIQITTVNRTVESQSKLINDFEKYKSLFDIDDFDKRLKLKLDIQKDELNQAFKKQLKESQVNTIKSVDETLKKSAVEWMAGWDELSQIALGILLKQFPEKKTK